MLLLIMRACSVDAKDHLEEQFCVTASQSSLFLRVIQCLRMLLDNEMSAA